MQKEKMSKKVGNIVYVALVIVAILTIPLLLARGAFALSNKPVGVSFEEHLWSAKECVAKEIGYTGSLDSEFFQISQSYDKSYRYVIKRDGVVIDSGTFSNDKAIDELNAALAYDDHHQGLSEALFDDINNYVASWAIAIFVWILTAGLIVVGAFFFWLHLDSFVLP